MYHTDNPRYGPATTLSYLTNLDETIAIALIGIVGTLYTTLGGIKAVVIYIIVLI